jgi:hypothetical protein
LAPHVGGACHDGIVGIREGPAKPGRNATRVSGSTRVGSHLRRTRQGRQRSLASDTAEGDAAAGPARDCHGRPATAVAGTRRAGRVHPRAGAGSKGESFGLDPLGGAHAAGVG